MAGKLRVLHIIPSLEKGGAERLVLDICNQFITYPDVEVKLVCLRDKNTYAALSANIPMLVVPAKYIPSITGKATDETAPLRQLLNEFKPHIIHTHLFEAEIAARATGYYNAAYICHCHYNTVQFKSFSLQTLTNKGLLANFVERKTIMKHTAKAVDNAYIAISEDVKTYFEENLPRYLKQKVVFMHNAIDWAKFSAAPLPQPPTDELRLINVGSFNPRKNQQLLVHLAVYLKQKGVNVKMTMYGDGADRPKILQLIADLGCADYVFAPGNIDNVEVPMANSHLYIHSALSEPFGLVIVEALASGLPVVALDGYGNRDLHKDGVTGFLMPDGNIEAFAEKVMLLANDNELYRQISEGARGFSAAYDIAIYTKKLYTLYHQLIDGKLSL